MAGKILVEISAGELIDRLAILQIKAARIGDAAKRANVREELEQVSRVCAEVIPDDTEVARLGAELKAVNEALWEIEDEIRACERDADFGPRFVALARSVYRTNDRRAAVKRAINLHLGSALVEEKSYVRC